MEIGGYRSPSEDAWIFQSKSKGRETMSMYTYRRNWERRSYIFSDLAYADRVTAGSVHTHLSGGKIGG